MESRCGAFAPRRAAARLPVKLRWTVTTIRFEHRECGLVCTLSHDRLAPESGTPPARR